MTELADSSYTAPEEQDLLFKLTKEEDLNNCVYRYILNNPKVKVSKFYPGLELSGLGYSMTSKRNYVNRYYTVCNAMNNYFHE